MSLNEVGCDLGHLRDEFDFVCLGLFDECVDFGIGRVGNGIFQDLEFSREIG